MSRPAKPALEPGCKCSYTWNGEQWILLISRQCPVHALPDEDYPGKND